MPRKTQTEYTREYRARLRREAHVLREVKELALDNPELMKAIREAEHRIERRQAAKAAGEL